LIEPLLQQFGIDWQLRPTTSNKDKGGISEESLPQCWLGASLKAAEGGLEVLRITDSSPAQQAGISAGDRIIALDQLQATEGSVKSALYNRAPGSTLQIHLFRRDELLEMVVTLQAAPADSVVLQQIASADDNQLQARLQWLGEDGTTT
jgi:predicted metalloprotease with PDZ domain